MKKDNIYLPLQTITVLKPNILEAMNKIYSSDFTMDEFTIGCLEDNKNLDYDHKFKLHGIGPSHNLFHCKHILDLHTIHRLKFENFDINLNQYLNNIFTFYLNFAHDTYIILNSRISFDKIYKCSYLNKIFKPSLEKDSRMKIEISFHSRYRYYGKIFIYFKLIDNRFVVDNKNFLETELKSLSGMSLVDHKMVDFYQNKIDFNNIF